MCYGSVCACALIYLIETLNCWTAATLLYLSLIIVSAWTHRNTHTQPCVELEMSYGKENRSSGLAPMRSSWKNLPSFSKFSLSLSLSLSPFLCLSHSHNPLCTTLPFTLLDVHGHDTKDSALANTLLSCNFSLKYSPFCSCLNKRVVEEICVWLEEEMPPRVTPAV